MDEPAVCQDENEGQIERARYVGRVSGTTKAGGTYNGTGFVLNPRGDVATCWHVVKTARDIIVKLPYTKPWRCKVLEQLEDEDVAVLVPDPRPYVGAPHAILHPDWFEPRKMNVDVELFGYSADPNSDFPNQKITRISNVYTESGYLVLGRDLPDGDSGGPVVNEAGHVIGIITLASRERDQAMVTPISRLCQLLKQKGILFAGPEGSGDLAEQAIESLPDLMRKRQVRKAVEKYGDVFENASRHVSTLHAYKKAHELLYDLELGCYKQLVSDVRHFPRKKDARDNMHGHLIRLKDHVSDAEDLVREIGGDKDIATMCDRLKTAHAKLRNAHREQNVKHCNDALEHLDVLVSQTQWNFNRLLNQVAKQLQIYRLIEALRSVQETISSTRLPKATAREFQAGVNDLDALGADLDRLTLEHDQWQDLDDVLRPINRRSPKLLSQIGVHWEIIDKKLGAVCSQTPAESDGPTDEIDSDWRILIRQARASLVEARSSGDLKNARLHFGDLRDYAAERFDRTDKRLLTTCAKISKVKDPLRTLVNYLS